MKICKIFLLDISFYFIKYFIISNLQPSVIKISDLKKCDSFLVGKDKMGEKNYIYVIQKIDD